jgi:hypothetical protein
VEGGQRLSNISKVMVEATELVKKKKKERRKKRGVETRGNKEGSTCFFSLGFLLDRI